MLRIDSLNTDEQIPDRRPQAQESKHVAREFSAAGQKDIADEMASRLLPWARDIALGIK
jgi:hypothetical protein